MEGLSAAQVNALDKKAAACAKAKAWRIANLVRYRETKKKYAEKNKERTAERGAKWAKDNHYRVKKNFALWYAKNAPIVRARAAEWKKNNLARFKRNQLAYRKRESVSRTLQAAFRRAEIIHAKPAWANDFFISEAYKLAKQRTKATGIKWEVDHIVPLKSKKVCGLHVEHNIRVIPAVENNAKGNRYWPDMP